MQILSDDVLFEVQQLSLGERVEWFVEFAKPIVQKVVLVDERIFREKRKFNPRYSLAHSENLIWLLHRLKFNNNSLTLQQIYYTIGIVMTGFQNLGIENHVTDDLLRTFFPEITNQKVETDDIYGTGVIYT